MDSDTILLRLGPPLRLGVFARESERLTQSRQDAKANLSGYANRLNGSAYPPSASACHAIRQQLAGREAELQDMEQRAANLLDQIERTTDAAIRDRYEARLRQLDGQKTDLERLRADDQAKLRRAESSLKSYTK